VRPAFFEIPLGAAGDSKTQFRGATLMKSLIAVLITLLVFGTTLARAVDPHDPPLARTVFFVT
jgi:hypothetical protein